MTLLDAHPEIAMSYELYTTLLKSINCSENLEAFLNVLLKVINKGCQRTE